MNEAQRKLYEAIQTMINIALKNIGANYYLTGKVISVSGTKATVAIDEQNITVPIRTGTSVSANHIVYVCVPNGNLSAAFVDCRRPT